MSGESVGGVEQFLIRSAAEIAESRHNLIKESLHYISGDLLGLRLAIGQGNLEHAQRLAAAIKLDADAITMQLEKLQ
jgi:hypothetical protein